MRHHLPTYCENHKLEVRQLKYKDIPDLVAKGGPLAVEDEKADVKDVIYVVLRSPTLMMKMDLVTLENEEVLKMFI